MNFSGRKNVNTITWWQSLIPVGAAIIGWGLAMIGQAVQASRVNRREHYYKVLERTEDILARCNALADFIYEFHKSCVKLSNEKPVTADESLLNDFITRFDGRLASIYMSQRIFYPGLTIEPKPISKVADELVGSIREMWELAKMRGDDAESVIIAARAKANYRRRAKVLGSLANELGIIMNSMVVSINKQAKKLRIRAELVTVDRTKLPDSSTESHQE
jgi:hypothetical protein